MDYEGRLTVQRGYGLTEHLLALKKGQSCYVPVCLYNATVVYSTLSRLKKNRGLYFITKRISKKGEGLKQIKVTRVENGTNTRTKTDCDSNG